MSKNGWIALSFYLSISVQSLISIKTTEVLLRLDLGFDNHFNPIHGGGGVNLTLRFQIFLALLNGYTYSFATS